MNAIDKELLPCPFCNSYNLDFSLKISTRGYNKQPSLYHGVIYCKNCHAYGQRVLCYSEQQYRYNDDEKKTFYEQAAKAWNTRPTPAPDDAALDALGRVKDHIEACEVDCQDISNDLETIRAALSPETPYRCAQQNGQESGEGLLLYKNDQEQAVWQAIQDIKIGNLTDDKLIVENLHKNGFTIVKIAAAPKHEGE